MACQPVRIALLLGAITAVAVSPARADDKAPATCAPAFRTIQCWECVPETYTVKRCSYKVECRTEQVDGFRCETVPETRERTVVCVKKVPVMTTETRNVCKTITVNETRTCYKTCYRTVQETVMKKKCVSRGHWECREKEACLANCLAKLHHRNDCCNPCCTPCPKTRTHKVWVHCPVYECCPVCVCRKVCEKVPYTVCVPVCKTVTEQCQVQVCRYNCVEEKRVEKYTCCVTRQVPCKITRTVRVCVPCEENVTCTRMVKRCVTKQVPCEPVCCETRCASRCCETSCCETSCCSRGHGHKVRGHGHRSNGCCCR
jgi:hypothetical protein